MPLPIDAYREGYEKARRDTLGGLAAEVMMGMMRDDPGGDFAAGYRDGAAGKKFNPPSQRPHADAELNPLDDKIAIKICCPNCGAIDWFEWKFLGKLTDPVCGYSWYVDSATYTLQQIRASIQFGGKMAKYLSPGKSGEQGAWIAEILAQFTGRTLGTGARLMYGLIMVPIQAAVRLFHAKQKTA